jgi:triosephosphate isomerase
LLIINYKAYEKAIGTKAENLTAKIESSTPGETEVIVAPQTADLNRVETNGTEKFAQHVDPVGAGSHTGSNQLKAVKQSSVSGTLINHSEKRLSDKKVRKTVRKCKEEGLKTVVCAQTPDECAKYADYNPDFIAFEPPELIGGDTAVSKAEPEIISRAVEKSGEVPTLTGAGIKSSEDVERSLELGCVGVLVASGVVKAEDVESEVQELCEPL